MLDVGPICGDNINFFAQRVKKLFVCDIDKSLDIAGNIQIKANGDLIAIIILELIIVRIDIIKPVVKPWRWNRCSLHALSAGTVTRG